MARKMLSNGLTGRINSLLQTRSDHMSAIEVIDATMARIASVLGEKLKAIVAPAASNGRGAPRKSKGRRRRGTFAMSGDESILAFVRSAGTPTTKEVNKHWKGEGRGGSADNALTKLVKQKKLKRIAIKGARGSKYSVL